jgi:hypothetical protein
MKASQTASCGKHQSHLKPEWVRVPDAVHLSGLSRSAIYGLIAAGAIKSFSNRQRGAQRGIRLISYDSLVGYLEEQFVAAARAGTAAAGASSTEGRARMTDSPHRTSGPNGQAPDCHGPETSTGLVTWPSSLSRSQTPCVLRAGATS